MDVIAKPGMTTIVMKKIKIGTRGSRLALIQANTVSKMLESAGVAPLEIVVIKTSGDQNRSDPIEDLGSKNVFVKEIEDALLGGRVDIAVHSLKDLPATVPTGLTIGAYLKAEDTRDVLVARNALTLKDLPPGAKIGTDSPRRRLQLGTLRPDIVVVPIRGNVDTRIKMVEAGEYDGVILAKAGLKRLGLEDKITEIFSPEKIVPSPCQGVIAVEAREGNESVIGHLAKIDDPAQRTISEIERGILTELGAKCTTPVGMSSRLEEKLIKIQLFFSDGTSPKYILEEFKVQYGDKEKTVCIISNEIRGAWKSLTGKELVAN